MIERARSGVFTARIGGLDMRGWSATVGEMEALLRRLGFDGATVSDPSVSTVLATEEADGIRRAQLDYNYDQWLQNLRAVVGQPERAELRQALVTLRADMPSPGPHAAQMFRVRDPDPGAELLQWLGERVASTNATAPQAGPHISVFGCQAVPQERDGPEARAYYLDWVDPEKIVATPDHEKWGVFDRAEPARRSLAGFCVTLHAATSPEALEAWIDRFVIGDMRRPVQLERVEGPAGPVYAVQGDGTHRAHFARVFGLPLLTMVRTSSLPRPLCVLDRPTVKDAPFGQWESLWRGLRKRGLLEVAEHPTSGMASWTPTRMCAEWMLMAPEEAAAVNKAYARAYPGALQYATGMSDIQLFDPEQWTCTILDSRTALDQRWRGRWPTLTRLVHATVPRVARSQRQPRTVRLVKRRDP
ncbi:hypothetical protein [Nocardia cyriacigeorgica]|uniref:hypothetical protein n=1 Tax=Nocardia cyriacigeorgica TaxID=135487 RepID=UPI001893DD4D|nr:hypothetical protein [Nocardia cyriacigeorgica]MBF6325894.1 hypothetical protein [Nocardia cyriacigeorgica]